MSGITDIVLVGPTHQDYYASFGNKNVLAICLLDDTELYRRKSFRHKWEGGKSYKPDNITALTMNEELGFFYGATEHGKVYCYHWYTKEAKKEIQLLESDLPNVKEIDRFYCSYPGDGGHWFTTKIIQTIEWARSTLPIVLDNSIIDLELNDDGTVLWLLSNNCLYRYELASEKLELLPVEIPKFASDDVEDESKEAMCVLRRTPYNNCLVLGGNKGTVVLVNVDKKRCYLLDAFDGNEPVVDIWWNEKGSFVVLNRAGKVRKGTMLLAYIEDFLPKNTAYLEHYSYDKLEALSGMTSSLFFKEKLTEEQTTFSSDGEEEGYYH